MSQTIATLRARHALVVARLANLDNTTPVPGVSLDRDHEIGLPAGWKKSAQELWEAKLIQIHAAAVIEGNELFSVDADGRCTECQLDLRALQRMQPHASMPPSS